MTEFACVKTNLTAQSPTPAGAWARINHLRLVDFRNYHHLDLSPSAPAVVLTGSNGAGKTNILEAISLLAPGRGLRRAALGDFARHDGAHNGWGVQATLAVERPGPIARDHLAQPGVTRDTAIAPHHPPTQVHTHILATGLRQGDSKRTWHVGDQPARSALDMAEYLRLLWFVPDMGRLFAEGPSGRRRFLDRLVFAFEPQHAEVVARYEHFLRERWLVLKHDRPTDGWLDRLEQALADDAVIIARRRHEMCDLLTRAAPNVPAFPDVALHTEGSMETWLALDDDDAIRQRLCEALRASRPYDRQTGGARSGPHKSDVILVHPTHKRPATACSTGEQKILLLATLLKFAALWRQHSTIPLILLLDDVAAHLDPLRRAALWDELGQLATQTWLTGTEADIFQPLKGVAEFFHVENGRVTAYDGATL